MRQNRRSAHRNSCFPTDLGNHRALVSLLQNKCDLRLSKLRCLHGTPLAPQKGDHNWKIPVINGVNYWKQVAKRHDWA